MDRNHQKIGIVNGLLLLVCAVVGVILARFVNSASAWVTSGLLGRGFLIALIWPVPMGMGGRERRGQRDMASVDRAKERCRW